jgi:hypothetical protein
MIRNMKRWFLQKEMGKWIVDQVEMKQKETPHLIYQRLSQRISTPSGHELSKLVTFLLCFSGMTHMNMVLP